MARVKGAEARLPASPAAPPSQSSRLSLPRTCTSVHCRTSLNITVPPTETSMDLRMRKAAKKARANQRGSNKNLKCGVGRALRAARPRRARAACHTALPQPPRAPGRPCLRAEAEAAAAVELLQTGGESVRARAGARRRARVRADRPVGRAGAHEACAPHPVLHLVPAPPASYACTTAPHAHLCVLVRASLTVPSPRARPPPPPPTALLSSWPRQMRWPPRHAVSLDGACAATTPPRAARRSRSTSGTRQLRHSTAPRSRRRRRAHAPHVRARARAEADEEERLEREASGAAAVAAPAVALPPACQRGPVPLQSQRRPPRLPRPRRPSPSVACRLPFVWSGTRL